MPASDERVRIILDVVAKNLEKVKEGVKDFTKLSNSLEQLSKTTSITKSKLDSLTNTVERSSISTREYQKKTENLYGSFRKLAWTVVRIEIILRGFERIIRGIGAGFSFAINSVEKFRTAIISLAAVRAMLATGGSDISTVGRYYEREKKNLDDFYQRLVAISAQTPVTTDQLMRMIVVIESFGEHINLASGESRKFILNLANAIYILTQGQRLELQLLQETRGIFGATNEQYAVLARLLRTIDPQFKEHVEQWRRLGTFQKNINKMLAAFGYAGKDIQLTFRGITTSWKSFFELAGKQGFEHFYDFVVTGLFNLLKKFWEFDEATQTFTGNLTENGKDVVSTFRKIGDSIEYIIKKLALLKEPVVITLRFVGKGVEKGKETLETSKTGFNWWVENIKDVSRRWFWFNPETTKAIKYWATPGSTDQILHSIFTPNAPSPKNVTLSDLYTQKGSSLYNERYLSVVEKLIPKQKEINTEVENYNNILKTLSTITQAVSSNIDDFDKTFKKLKKSIPVDKLQKQINVLNTLKNSTQAFVPALNYLQKVLDKLGIYSGKLAIENIPGVLNIIHGEQAAIAKQLLTQNNLSEEEVEKLKNRQSILNNIKKILLKIKNTRDDTKDIETYITNSLSLNKSILTQQIAFYSTTDKIQQQIIKDKIQQLQLDLQLLGVKDEEVKKLYKTLELEKEKAKWKTLYEKYLQESSLPTTSIGRINEQLKKAYERIGDVAAGKFTPENKTQLLSRTEKQINYLEKLKILKLDELSIENRLMETELIRDNRVKKVEELYYKYLSERLKLQEQLLTATDEEKPLLEEKLKLLDKVYQDNLEKLTDWHRIASDKIQKIWESVPDRIGGIFESWITNTKIQLTDFCDFFINIVAQMVSAWVSSWIQMKMMSSLPSFGGLLSLGGSYDTMGLNLSNMSEEISLPAFASGGYIDKPTVAIVGEKEPEWIIPESKLERMGHQTYNTIIINAIDVKTFEDYVRRNPGPIIQAVKNNIDRRGVLANIIGSL